MYSCVGLMPIDRRVVIDGPDPEPALVIIPADPPRETDYRACVAKGNAGAAARRMHESSKRSGNVRMMQHPAASDFL